MLPANGVGELQSLSYGQRHWVLGGEVDLDDAILIVCDAQTAVGEDMLGNTRRSETRK